MNSEVLRFYYQILEFEYPPVSIIQRQLDTRSFLIREIRVYSDLFSKQLVDKVTHKTFVVPIFVPVVKEVFM